MGLINVKKRLSKGVEKRSGLLLSDTTKLKREEKLEFLYNKHIIKPASDSLSTMKAHFFTDLIDLRKHKRFKVKDGAFVDFNKPRFFKLGKPRLIKFGAIINISEGGLAVQYIDERMWSNSFKEFSISVLYEDFRVEKIPFKTISDFKIAVLNYSMKIRKRCIQFGKLTLAQKLKLDHFIQNYTIVDM